ncbi:cbb3-type cytochrome c oxidase subunit 3 [Boseongicola aestuarii]|jgi:cytochrome c oxidase cbb3-type subunit 4|uniref:Cbb3-type cytochrome oxidase component FixQ n=1 Tax=Boseongicola aestuarii TaxID=1470561 RepID=A0A238J0G5_9RHOB|nr:cbb3-type cytochrome c oxidase subunit 3 [Boseongicola aestuarii]SMX24126.1 Cbb3-type cytochrome oxidase component FixQ [Boseongicola aestuarii]
MDTYSFLRELADSWVLLAMVIFYVGAIAWAFRPGSKGVHADIADIPFRNETLAEDTDGPRAVRGSKTAQNMPEAL